MKNIMPLSDSMISARPCKLKYFALNVCVSIFGRQFRNCCSPLIIFELSPVITLIFCRHVNRSSPRRGCTLIFSHIRRLGSFFGFKFLNFNEYFLGVGGGGVDRV